MQEHNFDEILEYLCSGIMSKSERQSVRDELYDHLMCKYETNLAIGMDEEKATEEAIDALGNKYVLKENLQKVHWYYPAQSLKSALNMLIISMVMPILTSFLANSPYLVETLPVFAILIYAIDLAALFSLRTSNSVFNFAFKYEIFYTAVVLLNEAVEPYVNFDEYWQSLILILLNLASVFLRFKGIKELLKPYSKTDDVSKISIQYVFILVNSIYFIVVSYNPGGVLLAWYLVMLLTLLYGFVSKMLKISDVLYKSDHEYKVELSVPKRLAVGLAVVVFAVCSIFAADLIYSNIKITKNENEIYTVNDCEMEESEYNRICETLVSYGIREEYVSVFPKSELMNYENAVNKSELTESAQQFLDYYDTYGTNVDLYYGDNEEKMFDSVYVDNYSVCLGYSEDGLLRVRFIKIFCVPSYVSDSYYKDAVVFDDEDFVYNGVFNEKDGDFITAMKLKDSKLYKKEVKNLGNSSYSPTGFIFDVEPGTIIIYATTKKLIDINSAIFNFDFTYYHQKYPITFPLRTIESAITFDEYISDSVFESTGRTATHYFAMPGREYVVPAETEKSKQGALVTAS